MKTATSNTLPDPAEIRAARLRAGLTQTEAAALIHVALRTWQQYESTTDGDTRQMAPGLWELFEMKATAIEAWPAVFRPDGKLVPPAHVAGWIRTRIASRIQKPTATEAKPK